jgi:hypothetical protein
MQMSLDTETVHILHNEEYCLPGYNAVLKAEDVLEEQIFSIFRAEQQAEQDTSVKADRKLSFNAGILLGFLLDPEDGDKISFRNVC